MAEQGETNNNRTTAPGSDNKRSILDVRMPPGGFDQGMVDVLEKQLKIQQEQTDQLEKLTERLKTNQTSIDAAQEKSFIAVQENDKEALEVAEKELWTTLRMQEDNQKNMGLVGTAIKTLQKEIDYSLEILADDSEVTVREARILLKATTDGDKNIASKLELLAKDAEKSTSEFIEFVNDFALKQKAGQEIVADKMASLDKNIAAASSGVGGMEKTGLALETLKIINETVTGAMNDAGVDRTDKEAVDRFKMGQASDIKVRDSIVKELIRSRETIQKDTVKKELQELYIKQGTGAAVAEIKAAKNAEKETTKRQKDVDEQIKIFKSMDETQRFQTTLVEADYRARIEAEKEKDSDIPEWAKNLVSAADMQIAILTDMRDGRSGILTKIFVVLALISGVIVGIVVETIKKIVDLFKSTGAIGSLFSKLRSMVPIIDKVAIGIQKFGMFLKEGTIIGRFFTNTIGKGVAIFKDLVAIMNFLKSGAKEGTAAVKMFASILQPFIKVFNAFALGFRLGAGAISWLAKLGPLLGRIFLPISIALTVIDAVIGAFKGFKKDGFAGIIPGIIAKIISGLTLGFVSFETLYKYIKIVTDTIMMPMKMLLKVFNFIGEGLGMLWVLVSDLFSGKGIERSFSNFFTVLGESFKNMLGSLYGKIINLFLKISLIVLDGIFAYYNWVAGIYKWIYKKLTMLKDWIFDIIESMWKTFTQPFILMYRGITTIVSWLGNFITEQKNMIMGIITKMFDAISSFFSTLTSWIPGFGGGEPPKEKYLSPGMIERRKKAKREAENLEKAKADGSLADMQKDLNGKMSGGSGGGGRTNVITTTTNVNKIDGGGSQQPTIIAPQPPRNSEPTIRAMQFGEQPAF